MPEEQHFDSRRELMTILLEKIRSDPYPSATMMDLVEQLLRRDEVSTYTRILMDKIHEDTYPSYDLMIRVRNLS